MKRFSFHLCALSALRCVYYEAKFKKKTTKRLYIYDICVKTYIHVYYTWLLLFFLLNELLPVPFSKMLTLTHTYIRMWFILKPNYDFYVDAFTDFYWNKSLYHRNLNIINIPIFLKAWELMTKKLLFFKFNKTSNKIEIFSHKLLLLLSYKKGNIVTQ